MKIPREDNPLTRRGKLTVVVLIQFLLQGLVFIFSIFRAEVSTDTIRSRKR